MASYDFDIVVDTSPMAQTVSTVSNHVTATTAAVAAMQTAVIAAEVESANKICENVDKGFYSLMLSQITSKISDCYTKMKAKHSLLLEYGKTLGRTRERMESDYNRVKRQYLQIFKGLDKALDNRIAQLDKAAMELKETRSKVILGMFEHQIPETIVETKEVDSFDQKIEATRLKSKTGHSLGLLADKVRENNVYMSLMDSMLEKQAIDEQKEEYIPVIYANKQSTLVTDSFVLSLHFPEYLPEQARNSISLNILNHDDVCDGGAEDFEKKTVSDEFQALVAGAGLDERVAKQMMALFQQGGC